VVLLMTGHEAKMARGIAVGAAATLLLSLSLIPVWGAVGAAVATATGNVASNVLLSIFAWRSVKIYTPAFGLHRFQQS
jgi:O-antigen/teichoic acid export membrane protein